MENRLICLLGIVFVLSLLSINLTSAESCFIIQENLCVGNNHILMGLSSQTNAHGELTNKGNYNFVLCCYAGTGNANCDGANKILGLEFQTNSHAEIPSLNNYNNDVCYEDFSCQSKTPCNLGDVEIISLFENTNSHLKDFNGAEKICCGSVFLDMDRDGIENIHDPDFDGDGILDYPYDLINKDADTDGDGTLNINDGDIDGDGILNGHDPDFDGNGTLDQFRSVIEGIENRDIDFDGRLNINDGDIDGDGLLNGFDYDKDGDGVVDSVCGNNVRETGEECDDGNLIDGDECSRICKIEGAGPVCGNNVEEIGEECDDGNLINRDGCSSICQMEIIDPPCPEGLTLCSDNTCSLNCNITDNGTTCNNNGICDSNEGCTCSDCDKKPDTCQTGLLCSLKDTGCCNNVSNGVCNNYCLFSDPDCGMAVCGNNVRELGEACDDGNLLSGDGCSRTCSKEGGGGDDDDDDDDKCRSNWDCSGWSECNDGFKTRTCIDMERCGTSYSKPSEASECDGSFISIVGDSIIGLGGLEKQSKVWGISMITFLWMLVILVLIILIVIVVLLLR